MNINQDIISVVSILVNVLLTVFLFGAIPFCANVIKKLTAIETTLKDNEWHGREIVEIKDKIHKLELERAKCTICNKNNSLG